MSDRGFGRAGLVWAAAALLATSAAAATRTTVSLVASDASAQKLGIPGVAVAVRGPVPSQAAAVQAQLARDLGKLVYTRTLDEGEAGDYDLSVTLDRRRDEEAAAVFAFEAVLTAADGAELWRAAGRTEVTGAPVDAGVFASIARNLLSALVRDGWLAPRYDPTDPPPAAPEVHRD